MLKEADFNGDNHISFEEFKKFVLNTTAEGTGHSTDPLSPRVDLFGVKMPEGEEDQELVSVVSLGF